MAVREARRFGLLAFGVPLLLYWATLNGAISSDYPNSILGTQFAMWRDHSFSLGTPGHLLVNTVDKGLYRGQYYSAISPGVAIVTYPFAVAGFALDGHGLNPYGNGLLFDEAAIALAAALAALFTYKLARLYAPPLPSLIATLSLALGTSVWPFATVLFIHDMALFFSVVAVYMVLRYCKKDRRRTYLALAGFSMSLAFFVEYGAALIAVPLIVYLLMARVRKRHFALFAGGLLVGPLSQAAYNWLVLGSPLRFPEQLKAGSSHQLIAQFNLHRVLRHMLAYFVSPYRGLLLLSPIVLFGIYGLYRMFRSGQARDAVLFISIFLAVLILYSMWQDWSGGFEYGPRFLILGLPYVTVPIAVVLSDRRSLLFLVAFVITFLESSLIQGAGALTAPLSSTGGGVLVYQPAQRIHDVLHGMLASWLSWRTGGWGTSLAQLFGVLIIGSVWAVGTVAASRLE